MKLTSKIIVSIAAEDLHGTIVNKKDGNVERSTTHIVHKDVVYVRLAVKAES